MIIYHITYFHARMFLKIQVINDTILKSKTIFLNIAPPSTTNYINTTFKISKQTNYLEYSILVENLLKNNNKFERILKKYNTTLIKLHSGKRTPIAGSSHEC